MSNLWGRGNPERRHPSDESLVAFLDGEISARKYRQIEAHLSTCWNCRRRREKLEGAIGEFVDYMDATCPPPPRAWRNFERGLAERERPKNAARRLPRFPMWALQYGTAALAVAAVVWYSMTPRTVSAKEFLDRGIRAESASVERAGGRMVYQKLRVRRTGSRPAARAATVELWRDVTAPRFRQVADDAVWGELDRILAANGMDPQRPLSPAGYSRWRERVERRDETVSAVRLPGGADAVALETTAREPQARDAIVQARLTVRAGDWHPLAETLKVQGAGELLHYELTEVAFDVRPLDVTVFADRQAPAAAPLQAKPPEASPVFPQADTAAVEIETWYALHRLRACLGEPVQVVRDASGRVAVQGLAETAARKQELLAALAGIKGLRVDIRTPDEYPAPPAGAAREPHGATEAEPQKAVLPIQEHLTEYFLSHPDGGDVSLRVAALSTGAVTLAGSFLADAWSLRRLSEAYPPERIAALGAAHQRLLEDMFRDHAAALREDVNRSSALLVPVLAGVAGPEAAGGGGLTAPADPCEILESAQTAERLTRGLLAGSNDMPEAPEQAARHLMASLRELHMKTSAFEAALKGGLAARECHCRNLARR